MTIFDFWRDQEHRSSMQAMQSELSRLRRWKMINEYVAAVAWLVTLAIAIYLNYGGRL